MWSIKLPSTCDMRSRQLLTIITQKQKSCVCIRQLPKQLHGIIIHQIHCHLLLQLVSVS